MKKLSTLILLGCLLGVLAINTCVAASNKPSSELKVVNKKIYSLRASLSKDKNKRLALQKSLATTEKNLGETAKKIKSFTGKIANLQKTLQGLYQQEQADNALLAKQTTLLQQQLRVAYRMGQHEYVKLLLNQKNPTKVGRVLKYLNYISQARLVIIHAIEQTLAQLHQTQMLIKKKSALLNRLKDQEQAQQKLFVGYKQSRLSLLAKINETISSKLEKLKYLQQNKDALRAVVKHLQNQAAAAVMASANFGKMRGQLPWPTAGRILKAFGQPILDSHIRYNGVLLAAKAGSPVKAIYPGKVVFANWLGGYGLLIIVQHGKHYMTLYGHNETLYKKKGELVQPGDQLATVGNSGGFEKSGLYFEIRHDGSPVNPVKWCHR